jgi:hypothetical protein
VKVLIFRIKKVHTDGKTHPMLSFEKGIALLMLSKLSEEIKKLKKSGMLKIKATNTTILKTNFEAYLSGTKFKRISTMVSG